MFTSRRTWMPSWLPLLIALALAIAMGGFTRPVCASSGDRDADDSPAVTVPLNNGRLDLGEALRDAAQRLGMDDAASAARLDALDWSIDVRSLASRMKVGALERLTGKALDIDVGGDRVEVRIDKPRLAEALKHADRDLQRWLADVAKFDAQQAPADAKSRFGLTFITADNARAPAEALSSDMKQRVVVLVHGLDDPGMMWSDLVPALHAAGYTVGRFDYPNDGPIAESADLLAQCLCEARAAGIERLDVIAHSMGGLIVRDVLTRAAYYNGDGSGMSSENRLPAIDRFIMCGTPNHGSNMARLRGIIELREHLFTALATGESLRDLAAMDGHGEAGIDLLPDSEFLRRLTARPLAAHTQHTIIAGRISPVEGRTAQWLTRKMRTWAASSSHATSWLQDYAANDVAKSIEQAADNAIDSVGDGCVSIESAQLEGVQDVQIVRDTHLGMILNVGGGDDEAPPAIPIILDRLKGERDGDR